MTVAVAMAVAVVTMDVGVSVTMAVAMAIIIMSVSMTVAVSGTTMSLGMTVAVVTMSMRMGMGVAMMVASRIGLLLYWCVTVACAIVHICFALATVMAFFSIRTTFVRVAMCMLDISGATCRISMGNSCGLVVCSLLVARRGCYWSRG